MEPDLFRRHLRRVLLRAIPLATATGALAGLGCQHSFVLPPLESGSRRDGVVLERQVSGERVTFDMRLREWVRDGDTRREVGAEGYNERTEATGDGGLHREVQQPRDGQTPRGDGASRPDARGVDAGVKEADIPLPDFTPKTNINCPLDLAEGYRSKDCRKSGKGHYQLILPDSVPKPLSFKDCSDICKGKALAVCPTSADGLTTFSPKVIRCEEKEIEGRRLLDCEFTVTKGCAVAGRRPHGLCDDETLMEVMKAPSEIAQGPGEAGLFFAELAYLEEAAVTAFAYLAEELKAYNAPAAFIAQAEAAIAEEVEHAALMKQLAHRYGATTRSVEVAPFALRPLAEIAFENAREGCVRESYGALMAMWQSLFAEDKAVRVVMERIAYEESQHAALSWAINDWATSQLSVAEQEQLAEEHKAGYAELLASVEDEPSPSLVQYAGFPTSRQAISLLDGLRSQATS